MENGDRDDFNAMMRNKIDETISRLLDFGPKINETENGLTPLHHVLQQGNEEIIERIIHNGADVNIATPDGQTPLHLAASLGLVKSVELIQSHGANMDIEDQDGYFPLYSAVRNGHLDVVRYFVSEGAQVNQPNTKGCTPLYIAAEYGKLDVVKYLIRLGAEVNKGDNEGSTALHSAAQGGELDVTKYLISHGAEVNKGDNEGSTALHSAAQGDHLDVTEYLISHGAEVNKGDDEGSTALHSAAQKGHLDITKYLVNEGAEVNKGDNEDRTALHSAAQNSHLVVSTYLISQGADVNKGDNETPLHIALQHGQEEVIEHIIHNGADVEIATQDGQTPLHLAASLGLIKSVALILSHGAHMDIEDQDGYFPLYSAVKNGHLDVVRYFVSEGAQVNQPNTKGCTPLYIAAGYGKLDILKYLIRLGAEVNKGDNEGSTALHSAAQGNHLDVTKYLISHGAEVNKGDNDGSTALHSAAQKGHLDVSTYLISQGAENDIHLAIQSGHTSTIEKLVSEGADLNFQAPDGQTCLHRAIQLCYNSEKSVQETETLRKISDEYYRGELSPKRALVFYFLENGAKIDVKDERGNLPIQYAKDEVVKQMILSRLSSFEDIKSYRDEPSSSATVSVEIERNITQKVELEDHCVSMFIPPGAVHQSDPCKITLTLLRDPPSVDIQDNESVACYGIRCDPPNMIFHRPVKIRIPHSTLAINPDQVKPDIVSCVRDSVHGVPKTLRKRSSSSPDEPPYCRVYKRHLELYIGRCAEWWVLLPLEQLVIRHQLMCTPYIPDTIERGKEIEVHLHVHANLPGMDAEVQEEEKKQSYHKVHPSVPISIATKSGDVEVTCYRQDEFEQRKSGPQVLSLEDVQSKLKHSILLPVTSREEDTDFPVTITITQAGKVGVLISVAFVIKCLTPDELKYEPSLKPASFDRVVEELSRSDLEDIDVQTIAEKMTVDQFYDLGVALGFRIQQLDAIEYKRFRDRQQATYDMLVTWRQAQPSGQQAKETLLALMKSLDSSAEEMEMTDLRASDIGSAGEVPDKTLLAVSRKIKPEQFFEIGGKLGLNKTDLEHIQHRTMSNRKDANIQMLSQWKASQTEGNNASQTLKRVWESLKAVPNVEDLEDDVPDQHGGVPETEELYSVTLPLKSLSLACSLGKALRLNDDLIVGFIDLPSSSELLKIARQVVDSWLNGLKEEERKDKFAKLLSEYNIRDIKTVFTGREEISKAIGSKTDLVNLCHRLNIKPSGVLEIMSTFVTVPPHMICLSALKMLKEWVHQGGTRERLLEVAHDFHFNDAAVKIEEAMKYQRSYIPFISHGIIDHKGGELSLHELGIAVSIPEGALPKGMRSVVTLRVQTHDTPRLPVREGEVVITPALECSLTQELLKPATVELPHCVNHNEHVDDSSVILYTKTGPETFGRRNLTPCRSHISKDKVKFRTCHLQVCALSSTDLQGLQLRCVVFQPLFMTPAEKPTLRVYIRHPYRNYIEDIIRKEKSSSLPYCQVPKEFRFCIESTAKDVTILFRDGSTSNERMMPIKSILDGKCSPLNFELQFSPEEKGKKNIHIDILQGTATRAEREFMISIEDEPDYAVDHTDSQGQLQYVSNNLLEILAEEIRTPKDLKSLGYQLGFSSSSMEKYNEPGNVSFDSVSRAGFVEMLHNWRRQVRPSEQGDELHLALQNAGLGRAAEVIELRSKRRFAQVKQNWEQRGRQSCD